MPTPENGRIWPQCCMVAYGWQCDMIGIPAVRHSDTEPGKHTNRLIFIYRLSTDKPYRHQQHLPKISQNVS